MPRGKKASANTIPSSSVSSVGSSTGSTDGTTSLKDFLFRIRDICRNHGVQMDENGNIYADLIYDDLLFLREIWKLVENGALVLDVDAIKRGTSLADLRLENIAALGAADPSNTHAMFMRLWRELQKSALEPVFAAREFGLMGLTKDDTNRSKLNPTLIAILDYAGKVKLAEHEDSDPYEYFTQDLKKQKSKYFGQFYTPTHVADACVAEIAPQFGEIGMDPMGGTGKFMRAAASYIHKQNPSISAADAFEHMRTMEIEPKVYRQGVIAAFTTYKKLPNMTHVRKGDSFDILVKEEEQVDFICANPPFGGTTDGFDQHYYHTTLETVGKRTKSIKKVRDAVKHPFPFVKKDTSVLALQLIVNKLKNGGRAAVIFNGTIMNNAHRDVMKWFLETCNLRKIVVIPSGTFQCTGIETYALVFWKGTPTTNVEYYRFGDNVKLGEFSIDAIQANGYDIRPIFNQISSSSEIMQYKTIEEACVITKGTVQASKAVDGDYNIYSAAQTVATHNEWTHEGEAVIFVNGSRGPPLARSHYSQPGEKFAASTLVLVLKPKDTSLSGKYLWYYLTLKKEYLLKLFESSNVRETINEADFLKFSLPIPPLAVQEEIVATLDRIYQPGTTELADTLKLTDKAMDLVLANPTGATLEPLVDAQRLIRKSAQMVADVKAQMVADVKAQMVAIMKSVGSRGFPTKTLGDFYESPKSIAKFNSKDMSGDGDTPFFNGKWDCPVGMHNQHSYSNDSPYFVIIKDGGGDHTSDKVGMGKFFKITGKCAITSHNLILTQKSEEIMFDYAYYYMRMHAKELRDKAKYSINLGSISIKDIYDFPIPVPPLDFQHSLIARLDALQSQLTALESLQKQSEDNARFILESYLSSPSSSPSSETAEE
jgi:restriction endonuclease S subunit